MIWILYILLGIVGLLLLALLTALVRTLLMPKKTTAYALSTDEARVEKYAKKLSAFIKSLEPTTFTPGNVNGDAEGNVNLEDVVTLAQCVAQWSGINYVEEALDPDGNGVSDLSDVVRLAQFVAQWDVEISQTPYVPQ